LMLAGAAYRFRLITAAAAALCLVAAAGTAFVHYRKQSQTAHKENLRKMTMPLDLPHLAIGGPAPEIDASDLSGQK